MIVTRKMAEDAWRVILSWLPEGLTENPPPPTTEDEVRASYRAASKRAHPDGGGDPAAFAAVDRAKHVLLEWLKKPRPAEVPHGEKCDRCAGKGFMMSQRGFRALRVQCARCRGTGELGVEIDEGDGR
jgi:DnaJ-class molecular chaperone